MEQAYTNVVMRLLMTVGSSLVSCGAETYRAEETIERMGLAAGMARVEVYAVPTGIIVTLVDKNGSSSTELRRIKSRRMSLAKVEDLNQISRMLVAGKIDVNTAYQQALEIETQEGLYNKTTYVLASTIATGSFVFSFGGWWPEFVFAAFAGMMIETLQSLFQKHGVNRFLAVFVGAAAAVLVGFFAQFVYGGVSLDIIVISSIMVLLPGLAITSAVRDVIYEDFLAGGARVLEASLVAVSIAAGVLFVYSVLSRFGGV